MLKIILTTVVVIGYAIVAYAILTVPRELKRIADELERINKNQTTK